MQFKMKCDLDTKNSTTLQQSFDCPSFVIHNIQYSEAKIPQIMCIASTSSPSNYTGNCYCIQAGSEQNSPADSIKFSATSSPVLKILQAAWSWHFYKSNSIQCTHCTLYNHMWLYN